jgi:hypothetical protein
MSLSGRASFQEICTSQFANVARKDLDFSLLEARAIPALKNEASPICFDRRIPKAMHSVELRYSSPFSFQVCIRQFFSTCLA